VHCTGEFKQEEVIMNQREIGEIRRHLRRDRSNITKLYGCYVNTQKQIISQFAQSMGIMPENEAEKYFAFLKKTLSGTIGKNLIDINFQTSQVGNAPEHKLLMQLRSNALEDPQVRESFYQKVIETVSLKDNYVILLGCDSYDVPFKSKDDTVQAEASRETYTFAVCAVCPVKQVKPALEYMDQSKEFHDGGMTYAVSPPELGFLFPAFDGRATNIYNALFYARDPKQSYESFAQAVFAVSTPKPAAEQKKSFEALLTTALSDECRFGVVQAVHDRICQSIQLHKESRIPDPLLISKEEVRGVLEECGVPEKNVAKFSVEFDEAFGFEAQLHPKNIIDDKKFQITTPDVSIKVSPERSDLIQTRIIDGVKYILICADENVEVNGVSIHIDDKEFFAG